MTEDWRDIPLDDVWLPARVANPLKDAGFKTLGQIADTEAEKFRRLPNIGKTAEAECIALLRAAMNGTLQRRSAATLGDLAKRA